MGNHERSSGLQLKLQNFEGPLDLLYHLIGKNKVNIYDVKIDEITEQYMDYLSQMEALDMEIASEFLVIAATLLSIKSKLLLPQKKDIESEEEGMDPKEELLLKVLEYQKYKEFSKKLRNREIHWGKSIYKNPEEIDFDYAIEDLNIEPYRLKQVYLKIIKRNLPKTNLLKREDIGKIIQTEKVSLHSKIREVIKSLFHRTKVTFFEIFFKKGKSKLEIITGFLAILELSKSKKIQLFQQRNFSDIEIHRRRDPNKDIELGVLIEEENSVEKDVSRFGAKNRS